MLFELLMTTTGKALNIFPHNYNQHSFSGPNKFTTQLFNCLKNYYGIKIVDSPRGSDVEFCLIQQMTRKVKPMMLRLDGIWFNSEQDYKQQNAPIKATYDNADAVIFQSQFNKNLTEHWFGKHKNSYVIQKMYAKCGQYRKRLLQIPYACFNSSTTCSVFLKCFC